MTERSVLITGPVTRIEPWTEAATEAGWVGTEYPLVKLEETGGDLVEHIDGLPDWIVITSSNALPILERTTRVVPELLAVPTAVVGEMTAERARAIGFRLALTPASGIAELAETLLEQTGGDGRILWPRGSVSDELAEKLRAGMLRVDDPVVYQTATIQRDEPAPCADAIFFASPSAVESWRSVRALQQPKTAIAIGSTTHSALEGEASSLFSATLSLLEPKPAELTAMLRRLAEDN